MNQRIDIQKQQPSNGQRCIIWDNRHKEPIFAYWFGRFERWEDGQQKGIIDTNYWQSEPRHPVIVSSVNRCDDTSALPVGANFACNTTTGRYQQHNWKWE